MRPVVCFDESPTQLIGEARADPGRAGKAGAPLLRVQAQRHRQPVRLPRRAPLLAQGEDHRAGRRRRLRPLHARPRRCPLSRGDPHPVFLDNLSTHSPAALYRALSPSEARRILRRLEFHYTLKHASWLNMVEIEIDVLRCQCLDRRIDSYHRLVAETAAWENLRTPVVPASTGCSQPDKPALKWRAPIQNQIPKSHNLCAEVQAADRRSRDRAKIVYF